MFFNRLFLLMFFVSSTSFAGAFDMDSGNDVYNSYNAFKRFYVDPSKASSEDVMLTSYTMGYVSGMVLILSVNGINKNEPMICIPSGNKTNNGQYMDIVGKYLEENPNKRGESGSVLITLALTEAFPCRKTNSKQR